MEKSRSRWEMKWMFSSIRPKRIMATLSSPARGRKTLRFGRRSRGRSAKVWEWRGSSCPRSRGDLMWTEGVILEGVVKNITSYGAFVDLGGIDGILHISDMSWGRIGHPSEMVKVGDHIKVAVLKFDAERERISLGMKQIR